jgi:hypothetical protein
MDITVHKKMTVLALRDMELILNSLLLCSEADPAKELRRQRFMETERKRELSKAWIQDYENKINAFYANEVDEFPTFLNSPGYEFTHSDAIYAWVNCTLARMDLFYDDSQNRVPFPSLLPPACVIGSENDVNFIASLLSEYYKDGMPWPGYWAFSHDQIDVFGSPKIAEIDFRENNSGGYVRENYLETLAFSFRLVQETVRRRGRCRVDNDVIVLYLNTNESNDTMEIAYINVRPCIQRRGLLTIFLYIIIEACLASGRRGLGVSKAIQFTQILFAGYGFATIKEEDRGKVDMELNGSEVMIRVLDQLHQKKAVKQLGNLRNLCQIISEKWVGVPANDSSDQSAEVQGLLEMQCLYFGNVGHTIEEVERTYRNPESCYYIDPRYFPTAAELRNPAYVQSLFPKPDTLPQRCAPDQMPGYVMPASETQIR